MKVMNHPAGAKDQEAYLRACKARADAFQQGMCGLPMQGDVLTFYELIKNDENLKGNVIGEAYDSGINFAKRAEAFKAKNSEGLND
jgi:hypothetical protein